MRQHNPNPMPTFSNVHAELDNHELHPPRDFSLADNDTFLAKNPLGDIEWFDTYWQRPILDFANAALPPLTLTHGDRYILSGYPSDMDTSIDYSIDGSIDMDTSMDSTAISTDPTDGGYVHPTWGDAKIGDIVEYYRLDNKSQPVYDWRAVAPQTGYQVFNLVDQAIYHYSSNNWKKLDDAGAVQFTATHAALLALSTSGQLTPGARYLLAERNIILTAVSTSALSIEGDYTCALPAHGYIELVAGAAGSVDSIIINGQELLSVPIAFDTDLLQTAASVADAIATATNNQHYRTVSIGKRIYIAYINPLGALYNGVAIEVLATGITAQSHPFANGRDVGEYWFKVKYNLDDDWIAEMADNQGNVVRCTQSVVDHFGINPYDLFPWAYPNVFGNLVEDAMFIGFPSGEVSHNQFYDKSIVTLNLPTNGIFKQNVFQQQSILLLSSVGGQFAKNTLYFTFMDFDSQSLSDILDNAMSTCTMVGRSITTGTIGGNTFANTSIELNGANAVSLSLNQISSSDLFFNNAQLQFSNNQMLNVTVNGNNAHFEMNENICKNCLIDITNADNNYRVTGNTITDNAVLTLQGAEGSFNYNLVGPTLLQGNNSQTDFTNNTLKHYCTLNLTNYEGTSFNENQIDGSDINFSSSNGSFSRNTVHHSNVNLYQHNNDCVQNEFWFADITSENSNSHINNNRIDRSTVKLSNTNAEFSGNVATYYSTYDLDEFLGGRFTLNKIDNGSELLTKGSTVDYGGIVVQEDTILDVRYRSTLLYDCQFALPVGTIRLLQSHVSGRYYKGSSNLEAEVTIDSSGVLDLGILDAAFSGILWINNTATLNEIRSTTHSPGTIILRPKVGQTLTLNASSINYKFASGIVSQPIDGSLGGFTVMRNINPLVITELFAG